LTRRLTLVVLAAAASAAVFAIYGANATALAAYPFDWSPDDGLMLDYARRVLEAPATLYPTSIGPFPCVYTPLVPAVLAPVVATATQPLEAARALALLWTAIAAAAIGVLVARRGDALLGVASAALFLAPLDVSYWHMLVRADTPMLALWLLAAVVLLPDRLRKGKERLGRGRVALGAGLLLLAVLAKPTAVLHGAPLVGGWLLVDRRGGLRLAALLTAAGLATLAALQWATSGGFLFALGLYRLHPFDPRFMTVWSFDLLRRTWLVALVALVASWRAGRRAAATGPDGAWLLVLGGALAFPALAKLGAYWNYLLPLLAGLTVLAGRLAAPSAEAAVPRGRPPAAAALVAICALALATTSRFPLPTPADRATSAAFVAFVRDAARRDPGPMLLLRADYASFVAGQPVEMGATDFRALAAARAPGVDRVLARLARRAYVVVSGPPAFLPVGPPFRDALAGYAPLGECDVGFFFGRERTLVLSPEGSALRFDPPAGSRCRAAER
jgi:hypothetical protein